MNISKYRRFLLRDKFYHHGDYDSWEQVVCQVTEPEKYTRLHSHSHPYTSLDWSSPNHPLVNKGIAYWKDYSILCVGYILKQRPEIYRPIYSHKQERQINKFLPNIPIVVKKREKYLIFVEIMRIKKIPRVIIDNIIQSFLGYGPSTNTANN